VEAPDEAGHMGNLRLKIEAIEALDERIVGTILKGVKEFKRYKVLLLPDHPTPLSVRTHTPDPVPYVIYSNEATAKDTRRKTFDEVSARLSGISIEKGFALIERFLNPCYSC
jgi:2,3-bisphosphoglycerate-independent phosphoglycerate mutase